MFGGEVSLLRLVLTMVGGREGWGGMDENQMNENRIGQKALHQNPLDEKLFDENWAHGFNILPALRLQ